MTDLPNKKEKKVKNDKDLSSVNRATPEGYFKYMKARPHYFKTASGKEGTDENIKAEFKKLRKKGMVAAARVSPHCNCKYCTMERDNYAAR